MLMGAYDGGSAGIGDLGGIWTVSSEGACCEHQETNTTYPGQG